MRLATQTISGLSIQSVWCLSRPVSGLGNKQSTSLPALVCSRLPYPVGLAISFYELIFLLNEGQSANSDLLIGLHYAETMVSQPHVINAEMNDVFLKSSCCLGHHRKFGWIFSICPLDANHPHTPPSQMAIIKNVSRVCRICPGDGVGGGVSPPVENPHNKEMTCFPLELCVPVTETRITLI